jgi:hypothetical protein
MPTFFRTIGGLLKYSKANNAHLGNGMRNSSGCDDMVTARYRPIGRHGPRDRSQSSIATAALSPRSYRDKRQNHHRHNQPLSFSYASYVLPENVLPEKAPREAATTELRPFEGSICRDSGKDIRFKTAASATAQSAYCSQPGWSKAKSLWSPIPGIFK